MQQRLTIGVLFGGRSGEHEVSLVSATSVIAKLDKNKYEVILIGISKEGHFIYGESAMKRLKEDDKIFESEVMISADPFDGGLIDLKTLKKIKIGCFFPVLHGTYGEDGTIQGLLDLSGVAYVGAGVLGSACGMDKIIMKRLFKETGLRVVDDYMLPQILHRFKDRFNTNTQIILKEIKNVENKIGYNCFVKPANMGSSVGISKAHNREELVGGILEAFKYDNKILIEKAVEKPREIECAVLGNDEPRASVLGEIFPSEEFYSYEAKYVSESKTDLADLPENISQEIQKQAINAFKAVDCQGMARVDFLVSSDLKKIYINEINTIPGFTTISMYPKLWEKTGLAYEKLLDELIQLALERNKNKKKLKTSFEEAGGWHRHK